MADIITYPENGITYDADDASGFLSTRLSGVYSAEEDFSVTAQGGLSVQVSAGQAWVRPARFKGRSIIMEQPTTVVLTEADPVRSRIDRIVLRYDAAAKKTRLQVLDGTPDSAAPAAPEISRTELVYDLCLAEIRRPAGSTAVTAADITDTRADEAVCGVMRDGVTGIPTGTLVQQWQAVIESMRGGSFYTRAEVDALLNALQKQIGTILAKPVYCAPSATTQTMPDNVDYVVLTGTDSSTMEDSIVRELLRGKTTTTNKGNYPCRVTFAKNGELTVSNTSVVQNIIGFHYEASVAMPCAIDSFTLTRGKTYKASDDIDYIAFKLNTSVSLQDPNAFLLVRGGKYLMPGTNVFGNLTFALDGTISYNVDRNDITVNAVAYHYATPTELSAKLTATQSAQADADALNVDQEYRLTLLELGVTDDETTESA